MQIPFAKEAYRRDRAFIPEQTLLNLIVEKDASNSEAEDEQLMLLQRPGLAPYASLGALPVQCVYSPSNTTFNKVFAVSNNKLYSLEGGTSEEIGELGGSDGLTKIVANFDRLAIVSYPLFYLYGPTEADETPSFRNVVIPDEYLAVDVAMINGYFFVACEDGTFYWLEPGQDEFDPLNFADAEGSPDGLVGVTTLNGNLVFFGNSTTEIWQATGDADLPFARTSGQDYQRGALCRAAIQNIDNAIIWVGDDAKVYRADSVPLRISTDGLDERLAQRNGPPSAWTFTIDSHLFYVLRIPGQGTFAYDISNQTWSEFQSAGYDYWRPQVGCSSPEGWLCGDSETGNIWQLTPAATDAGEAFPRRASATAPVKSKPQRVDNLALDIGCSAPCEFRIRWAEADEALADQEWIPLQATRSGADVLTYYRMGAARSPYRTFEFEVTDPVLIRVSGARVGEAWR